MFGNIGKKHNFVIEIQIYYLIFQKTRNMLKKSKALWQKVSRIRKVCDSIEKRIEDNEKKFLFFVKLSLDYEYAVKNCEYVPTVQEYNNEINKIFEQSQKYLKRRAFYIRKLQLIQTIIRYNNLEFFVSTKKVNEKSYYDNLL
jgi:hypothetical protein